MPSFFWPSGFLPNSEMMRPRTGHLKPSSLLETTFSVVAMSVLAAAGAGATGATAATCVGAAEAGWAATCGASIATDIRGRRGDGRLGSCYLHGRGGRLRRRLARLRDGERLADAKRRVGRDAVLGGDRGPARVVATRQAPEIVPGYDDMRARRRTANGRRLALCRRDGGDLLGWRRGGGRSVARLRRRRQRAARRWRGEAGLRRNRPLRLRARLIGRCRRGAAGALVEIGEAGHVAAAAGAGQRGED